MRVIFWLGTLVVLAAITAGVSLGPNAERDWMALLRQDAAARAIISLGPELQPELLSGAVPALRTAAPNLMWLRDSLDTFYEQGTPANRVIAYAKDRDRVQLYLALTDQRCEVPTVVAGGIIDKILVRLAPNRHARRAPVLVYRCRPGSMPA